MLTPSSPKRPTIESYYIANCPEKDCIWTTEMLSDRGEAVTTLMSHIITNHQEGDHND